MASTDNVQQLFAAARARGQERIVGIATPAGLDHLTPLLGLVSQSIELGKLLATEERDLKVIETHYQIEMARIQGEFRILEAEMAGTFKDNATLRAETFLFINKLADAGHFELAMEAYRRLMDALKGPSLEERIDRGNAAGGSFGSRIRTR